MAQSIYVSLVIQSYEIADMINEGYLTRLCKSNNVSIGRVYSGRYRDSLDMTIVGDREDLISFLTHYGIEDNIMKEEYPILFDN